MTFEIEFFTESSARSYTTAGNMMRIKLRSSIMLETKAPEALLRVARQFTGG
jgi:hypothetical protein